MNQIFRWGVRTVLMACVSVNAFAALCNGTNENSTTESTSPTAGFTDNADGTVTDKNTGLMWKRCSEGQVWDGAGCGGTAAIFSWEQSLSAAATNTYAGHNDWRLPNVKELESIVELRCWDPAINNDIFPATPYDWFWSSSVNADGSGSAWIVYFNNGHSNYTYLNFGGRVRLVRDASLPVSLCGNSICNAGESILTCPKDCKISTGQF